jgi:hypothetical protein
MYIGVQRLHETGHWFLMQLYQRGPTVGFLGLLQSWDTQPSNLNNWQVLTIPGGEQGWLRLSSLPQSSFEWISLMMMGQLFQIFAILLGLYVLYRSRNRLVKEIAFLTIFLNAFSQLFYMIVKLINISGGDEYFATLYMDISPRLITGSFALFYCAIFVFSLHKLGEWPKRFKYLLAGLLSFSVGPILGILDKKILQQSLLDNPFVQPIIGFSMPVLLLDIIIVFLLLLLIKNINKR